MSVMQLRLELALREGCAKYFLFRKCKAIPVAELFFIKGRIFGHSLISDAVYKYFVRDEQVIVPKILQLVIVFHYLTVLSRHPAYSYPYRTSR